MKKPAGFFLTFEGLDGSGKSTQLRLLASALRQRDLPVRETRQPGGTEFGDRLRSLLLEARGGARLEARAELAMMFADRAQTLAEVVRPSLASGELLLCDRWTDSTEAYQGGGRQLGAELVLTLHEAICGGLQPDLTILLLPPIELALARARQRNALRLAKTGHVESRFESETDAFFRRTHAQYERIAKREPVRVVVIDSDEPIEAIHTRIVRLVEERLV